MGNSGSLSGVTSVTAGDTSIVVGGSPSAPTVETATLDVIATDHPPAAGWSNNSYPITAVSDLALVGITGAVAASRFVGATTSGPPITGTFLVGDFTISQAGNIWVCTVAGSPGTWLNVNSPANSAGGTVATPTGTTSTTLVMAGLGSTMAFTPSATGTGKVLVTISCVGYTITAAVAITLQPVYGTGTAPINGAAASGTAMTTTNVVLRGGGVTGGVGYTCSTKLSLTPGTAYWWDFQYATASSSDAAIVTNITYNILEVR